MISLLYARDIPVSEAISIHVPSVGEVIDNEDEYYNTIFTIIATPFDMMVQLDDNGIDFTKITDYDLFLLLFQHLQKSDTSLIFGDLSLDGFKTAVNSQNGEYILVNEESNIIIDRIIHRKICDTLHRILGIPKNNKKPGNEEAKKYLLDRARQKQKRHSGRKRKSQLEEYIVALVNAEQFPYNYETIRDISIYQFYASLEQISHKIKFDNIMIGYYAGTVKGDDLKPSDKTWIMTNSK